MRPPWETLPYSSVRPGLGGRGQQREESEMSLIRKRRNRRLGRHSKVNRLTRIEGDTCTGRKRETEREEGREGKTQRENSSKDTNIY